MPTQYRTPQEVAELWQCTTEHVLDLIRSGRLRAFSLSKPGSKRPRWRISADAIAEYESRHQAGAPPATSESSKKPKPKPKRRQDKVIEFYR